MLPPSLQHSFHSFHAVQSEQELLVCLINCILSFNPDIILAYEVSHTLSLLIRLNVIVLVIWLIVVKYFRFLSFS